MSGVDVTNLILGAATLLLPMLGLVAKLEANKFLKSRNDTADQAYLDGVIDQVSQLALNEAHAKLKGAPVTVDLHSDIVNGAFQHFLDFGAAEQSKLGYSNADILKLIAAQFDLSGGTVTIAGAPPASAPTSLKSGATT
jgi:hypothetical protein